MSEPFDAYKSTNPPDEDERIAIIGLACRFPGARDADQFWANLRDGVESIRRFDPDDLVARGAPPTEVHAPNYVPAGAPLEGASEFDASFFDFTPNEARFTDPQHRLFLEQAWNALEDAGYDPSRYKGRIGVFGGVGSRNYLIASVLPNLNTTLGIEPLDVQIGTSSDYLTTRVSYKLNLTGPSVNVQTACSTSLVAIHLACESLYNHESDLVLAGGATVLAPQENGYTHIPGGIMSPDGHCRAFDARGAGTVFGSGVGVVVLKRLSDALRDGDHIEAVILGTAISNDGAGKAGFTAPSIEGQRSAIEEALAIADVDADSISFVEAHGTGTALGDPIEVEALSRAFRKTSARSGYCAIGSVKTNIGHADAAAGIAGLIKTVLALRHGQIPPTLHFETPNPKIAFEQTPFFVNTALQPWTRSDAPRRACVNSLGVGGTNAFVVIQEGLPQTVPAAPSEVPPSVLAVSARTETALENATARLRSYLETHPDAPLQDVAYTLEEGRTTFPHRRAVVCTSTAEAARLLTDRDAQRIVSGRIRKDGPPPVVYLFSGQGAQYPGMARKLYQGEALFRQIVDEGAGLLYPHLGLDIRSLLFPEQDSGPDTGVLLQETRYTQPALFLVEYALARLLMERIGPPAALLGHSIGEWVAACLAGVFNLEDALRLVALRGCLMHEQAAGGMHSVPLGEEAIAALLPASLSLAAANGPALSVVSGPHDDLDRFEALLAEKGLTGQRLKTSHAFHSAMMQPMAETFRNAVAETDRHPPRMRFVSNVSGTWITASEACDPDYWVRHILSPVRFFAGLTTLFESLAPLFLEVGPGTALTTFVRQHPNRTPQTDAVATLPHPKDRTPDDVVYHQALGTLWTRGVPVQPLNARSGRRPRRISLPTYPFEYATYWLPSIYAHRSDGAASPPTRTVERESPSGTWFYAPDWSRVTATASDDGPATPDRFLIFTAPDGPGVALAARLRAAGHEARCVLPGTADAPLASETLYLDPAASDGYRTLFDTLAARKAFPHQIVFAWGLDAGSVFETAGCPLQGMRASFQAVSHLREALARFRDYPVRLTLLTSNGYDVTGTESIRPEQALLLGPALTALPEVRHLTTNLIDVDEPNAEGVLNVLVRDLSGREVTGRAPDPVRALRGRHAWTPSLTPVTLAATPLPPPTFASLRTDGAYVVVGDLSGAAGLLVDHLTHTRPVPLAVIRTDDGPASTGTSGDEAMRAPAGRRDDAFVQVVDVLDRDALAAALAAVRNRFGQINGVFYFTGSHAGAPVAVSSEALHGDDPWTNGLHALDTLLDDDPLDFLFLLPSAGGPPLDAAATSGRAFVDAFAHARSERHPDQRTLSIHWTLRMEDEETGGAASDTTPSALRVENGLAALSLLVDTARSTTFSQVLVSPVDPRTAPDQKRGQEPSGDSYDRVHESAVEVEARFEEAPRFANPTQRKLAVLWTELLGHPSIGPDDNFFDLGGHSLLALQLVARIEQTFGVQLSLRTLFDAPSLSSLSKLIQSEQAPDTRANRSPRRTPEAPGAHLPVRNEYPLSSGQLRFWFLDQFDRTHNAAYNLTTAYRLDGTVDAALLAECVGTIIERHEVLRTRFVKDKGGPMQVIAAPSPFFIEPVDLRALPAVEQDTAMRRHMVETARAPFDLSAPPLMRSVLYRLADRHYTLFFVTHHIVTDGWSLRLFKRELLNLYEARVSGRPAALPALNAQYRDYVLHQQDVLNRENVDRLTTYWKNRLRLPLTALDIPTDRPRPPVQTFEGSMLSFEIEAEPLSRLAALASENGASLFMGLLAVYALLLHRLSGQRDITIGTPISLRGLDTTDNLIGFFLNTLVLRIRLDEPRTFRELLAAVRTVALEAFDHQTLPFERLVEEIQPPRELDRTPLFQTLFVYEQMPDFDLESEDLRVEDLDVASGHAQFDLALYFRTRRHALHGSIEYNTALFDVETVERYASYLNALIEAAVEAPEAPLAELTILPAAERDRLLRTWNSSEVPYPAATTLPLLIEERVRATPDAPAVTFDETTLTYRELNAHANQLAHRLRELGVGAESRVGLLLDRSIEMLVSLLAVLKAGGAYVPLDPGFPAIRLTYMADDAGLSVLITTSDRHNALPEYGGLRLLLDAEDLPIDRYPTGDPAPLAGAESLAYIIYTSGSTGLPKGVQIEHRALVNFLCSMREQPGLQPEDVLLSVTTLSFDIAGLELYLPLITGARVVIATREQTRDGRQLARALDRYGVTCMQATPATWRMLVESGWSGRDGLKMLSGGEPLPAALAQALLERGGTLWNMYGPTETTIWSSAAQIEPTDEIITIGRPIANTQLYILDESLQLVPVGVTGTLYIGGAGLARGYLDRPGLTGEKFIPNPFGPGHMYNTGDLARRLPDGRIVCLGRIDHQVKVRGYRIELGEIEAVLEKHEAIEQAVVVAREDDSGLKQLVGYVVPVTGETMPPVAELRVHLQQKLPDYMIPGVFVAMDELPLTPNGKVDRKALPEPATHRLETGRAYEAPRDEFETALVEIWQDVLGVEPVSIHDNFFDLGGHSLNMLVVVDLIEQRLNLQLPVRVFFESPTVEAIARMVRDPESHMRKSGLHTLWSSFTELFNRGRDRITT